MSITKTKTKNKTIFERLRADHDVQRKLLDQLLETVAGSENRSRLFFELKHELDEHAKYEERYFYNRLIKSDMTQNKARHGIAEHKDIDDILENLVRTDLKSNAWIPMAKKLNEKVKHHLKEEEQEFFQIAGHEMSDDEKLELGQKYNAGMKESITRY